MKSFDDDEIELILSEVERMVGSLANGQREQLVAAIRENADGVLALAKRIAAKTGVRSPIAVLVTSIDRGEHRLAITTPPRDTPPPPPPRRSTTLAPLTPEQVAYNRRAAALMRRTVALAATEHVQTATRGLSGHAALDAAEHCLDELENEPDPTPADADEIPGEPE